MSDDQDHYQVLGVSPSATTRQVRVAYRRGAKLLHPDRGGKAGDFDALQRAYDVLFDPHAREMFDVEQRLASRRSGRSGRSGNDAGFGSPPTGAPQPPGAAPPGGNGPFDPNRENVGEPGFVSFIRRSGSGEPSGPSRQEQWREAERRAAADVASAAAAAKAERRVAAAASGNWLGPLFAEYSSFGRQAGLLCAAVLFAVVLLSERSTPIPLRAFAVERMIWPVVWTSMATGFVAWSRCAVRPDRTGRVVVRVGIAGAAVGGCWFFPVLTLPLLILAVVLMRDRKG